MNPPDLNRSIPTWAGRAPLRWHAALAAGLALGFIITSILGEVL